MGVRLGFQGAEIHVFPNEAIFEGGGNGKRGGVAVASKEIRSLGRDSKRVVMPRREGYCGYTASSCTRLPVWGGGGSWCRACHHSRLLVQVHVEHEVGGRGLGPEAMNNLAKAARPPCSPWLSSREQVWENSQLVVLTRK